LADIILITDTTSSVKYELGRLFYVLYVSLFMIVVYDSCC